MVAETIVLDNSVNSRLLWPDVESPANNGYARKVIRGAAGGSELHVPTMWLPRWCAKAMSRVRVR